MSDLQPNDLVDITVKGARVRMLRSEDGSGVTWMSYDVGGYVTSVPLAEPVTVERVAPAEWPPRPGDLWRSGRGNVWFVAEKQRMIPAGGGRDETPTIVLGTFGPLTLVHREDEQDAAPTCTECGVNVIQVDGAWVHAAPTVGAHTIVLDGGRSDG